MLTTRNEYNAHASGLASIVVGEAFSLPERDCAKTQAFWSTYMAMTPTADLSEPAAAPPTPLLFADNKKNRIPPFLCFGEPWG